MQLMGSRYLEVTVAFGTKRTKDLVGSPHHLILLVHYRADKKEPRHDTYRKTRVTAKTYQNTWPVKKQKEKRLKDTHKEKEEESNKV